MRIFIWLFAICTIFNAQASENKVFTFSNKQYLVDASHENQSTQIFTTVNVRQDGEFMGKRYGSLPNIIWVLGGYVQAVQNGNYLAAYRMLSE